MNRYTLRTGIREVVMILIAVVYLIPLFIMLNMSVKTPSDPTSPIQPTVTPVIDNYVRAWSEGGLGPALVTSLVITTVSVALLVLLGGMAAYPLARVTRTWSTLTFALFMVGLLLPFQLALLPLYGTMRDLGLLGSVWSLIIFYTGTQMPFTIFLYMGFLRAIPLDYEEAAAVDGSGSLRTFFSVVFPLLRPVTGTVIILNTIVVWNDFLTPLLYLAGQQFQTVPISVFSFVGKYSTEWNVVFAGLAISIAPVLIVYFALQRHIIKGFTSGLKG